MKFFYVYILKSLNKDFIYVGFTKNLKQQFVDHNEQKEISTKPYAPFELIHYEAYRSEKDAKRREEYLKTSKGKTTLRYMLKDYFQIGKSSLIEEMPEDAIPCPVCGGLKVAPTKSFFIYGDRKSGLNAICLTCKGKGWVLPNKLEEMGGI